jgi:anti-sigma B factor antagonist
MQVIATNAGTNATMNVADIANVATNTMTNAAVVLQLVGPLTAANALAVEHYLLSTMQSSLGAQVVVDLSQVDEVDNAGLMALVSALRLARRYDCTLELSNVPPVLQMVLELSQVDRLFSAPPALVVWPTAIAA